MERSFFEPAADYNSPGITVSELLRIAAGGGIFNDTYFCLFILLTPGDILCH